MIFVGHLIIIQQSMNKKTNKRFHRDLRMLLKPADTVSYSGNRLYLFLPSPDLPRFVRYRIRRWS